MQLGMFEARSDLPTIEELIERKALFVVNHSGGKDSQAMMIKLKGLVPQDQLVTIHAALRGVEWADTREHAEYSSGSVPFHVCEANKSFIEMVRHRQKFPSPQQRQCTSDLKRGPIEKFIRHELKQRGLRLVVNCMGLRAEESNNRAKAVTFKFSERNSKAGREWYEWLPIHDMLEEEVFRTIAEAGEQPHWAYSKGMSRLSCMFCIMASKSDLRVSARLNPEHFKELCELEREIGQSMMMPVKGTPTYLKEYLS